MSAACELLNFVVWGVFGGILCLFGYVGNLLSIVALQRECRSATTTLLQSLALSDLVLLVSVAVTDAIPYICDYTQQCTNPWRGWPHVRFVWLLTPVAHMASIWLVVLIAANRYWAVCRPHDAARVWTSGRTVGYVVAVVVAVLAFNSPRLFEYRIETIAVVVDVGGGNGSASSSYGGDFNVVAAYRPEAFGANESSLLVDLLPTRRDVTTTTTYENATIFNSDGRRNETVTGPATAVRMREVTTELGASVVYRVVYKVVFVNFLLVLLPLVTLIVLSTFVIRTLKRTPSYRLSFVHTRPLLSASSSPAAPADKPSPAAGAGTRNEAVADAGRGGRGGAGEVGGEDGDEDDEVDADRQQQQQLTTNGLMTSDERTNRSSPTVDKRHRRQRPKFSFKRFKDGRGDAARKESRSSTTSRSGGSGTNASREVTFVLVTVVLVAVVCQSPLAVFHFVRYAVSAYRCGHVIFYLETGAKLLVNINSCVNFVIYCLLSPKFRRRLLDALTCQPQLGRGSSSGYKSATAGTARRAAPGAQFELSGRY
jgi:hypothetical protein